MLRVIEERAASPEMASVPGGQTGLLFRRVKSVRVGKDVQTIEEYAVDAALLKELRDHEGLQALNMKRADGHAIMVGGDRDQVVAQIADLFIARRDILLGSGSKRGITVSAPTNEDVADLFSRVEALPRPQVLAALEGAKTWTDPKTYLD